MDGFVGSNEDFTLDAHEKFGKRVFASLENGVVFMNVLRAIIWVVVLALQFERMQAYPKVYWLSVFAFP